MRNDVESTSNGKYILDGGALLHNDRWVEGETYQQIIDRYIKKYIWRCCLVFDGYNMIGTTTEHEHQRITSNKKTSANVVRVSLPAAFINQNQFLLNNHNMYQFIKFLSMQLTQPGNQVTQCEEDADIVIVKQALGIAATVTVPCNSVSR